MKPLIGITVDVVHNPADGRTKGKLELNWNYAQAIADAGGIPLLIPPQADADAIAPLLDGLMIPGGRDIDASHWGEANHAKTEVIDYRRFEIERKLYDTIGPSLPVLGICYGCQFVNVMRGGSLHQHLPEVVDHEEHSGGTLQRYMVDRTSKLGELVGDCAEGQSWHHQAIDRLGEGLKVTGRGEDGVVEAIEATDRPWLVGIQWHPERTPDDEATQRLFKGFVEAARQYAESK